MTRKHIALFFCIPGGLWTFMAGFYFAIMWARQFPHGIILLLGGCGLLCLISAAVIAFVPDLFRERLPRRINAVLLPEEDQ